MFDRGKDPGTFYKAWWATIKDDIISVFKTIHLGRTHGFSKLNKALVTLLPKKQDANTVLDFRPISLVHSIANPVAKTMSLRLAPLLPTLISPNQSIFIKGRAIHDNFMMVQQLAAFHAANSPTVLLKLDIARAFDTVSWPFLFELMQYLGFGHAWINLVCLPLYSESTMVLVNSRPGDEIYQTTTIVASHKVTPLLQCYLFWSWKSSIVLSTLQHVLVCSPISRAPKEHVAPLYADDTVVFLKPAQQDCETIRELLRLFGETTGLHTNILNSSATPIRCSDQDRDLITQCLHCPIKDFPIPYLGVPLSIWRLKADDLQPLTGKLHNQLSGRRAGFLSKGDKLVLVKSVLAATPIHTMLATDMPKAIKEAIIKCLRSFFWADGRDDNGGNCTVAWSGPQRP